MSGRRTDFPVVSVLVPCFNYGSYLPDALDSVLKQDYPGRIECIVVDDGSTDNTAEVVRRFTPPVRYIYQKNRGQAGALNTAFRVSTGDVVCLLDPDDLWFPGKVRRVVELFLREPQTGLVHHRLRVVDGQGRTLGGSLRVRNPADGDVSLRMRKKVLPYPFWFASALSLRRAIAELVFPLSERQKGHADGLVATSAALLTRVRFLDEPLGTYRVHGGNLWAVGHLQRDSSGDPGAERRRAARFVADLEDKVQHANRVLERSGRAGGLSPWMNWTYLKSKAALEGRSPASFLPRALRAAWRCPELGVRDRVEVSWVLFRRSMRAALGARPRWGSAAGARRGEIEYQPGPSEDAPHGGTRRDAGNAG